MNVYATGLGPFSLRRENAKFPTGFVWANWAARKLVVPDLRRLGEARKRAGQNGAPLRRRYQKLKQASKIQLRNSREAKEYAASKARRQANCPISKASLPKGAPELPCSGSQVRRQVGKKEGKTKRQKDRKKDGRSRSRGGQFAVRRSPYDG